MLSSLLETAKLEQAYVEAGAPQKLTATTTTTSAPSPAASPAKPGAAAHGAADEEDDDDGFHLPPDVAHQLGCTDSFKAIQYVLCLCLCGVVLCTAMTQTFVLCAVIEIPWN